jgi:hypothetical protein
MEEGIIDMYAHLHLFQQETATIIEHKIQIQENLTQLNTIQEGICNINKWILKNLDAPTELYPPSTS